MSQNQRIGSVQELVPWMFPVNDRLVACKDSGFMGFFEFDGIDGDASRVSDINALSSRLDDAMRFFQEKPVSVWWTVRRTKTTNYPDATYENPVSAMLDQENKKRFLAGDNYINRHYVSVLFLPEKGADRFFSRVQQRMREGDSVFRAIWSGLMSIFSNQYSFAYAGHELASIVEKTEEFLSAFSSTLADANLRRLTGTEMIGFLRAAVHPGEDHIPLEWDDKWFLDSMLPETPITVGESMLKIGDVDEKYVSALSMKSWPEATWTGMFDRLLSLPGEMVLSHAFRVAKASETRRHIESVKGFNDLLKYPLRSWLVSAFRGGVMNESKADPARHKNSLDAQEATGVLTSGQSFWGRHNITMLLIGKSAHESAELAKMTVSLLQNSGMSGVVRETIGLVSAYAATLPGQWYLCERWAFLSMQNVTDMAPLRSVLKGEEINRYLEAQTGRKCPALTVLSTDYRTPYYFNFHADALAHTLVLGPSRSGKSVMMNFLLSQWRKYHPCRVIIFDKDMSCKIATLAQGGEHINLSADAKIKLNPLLLIDDSQNWAFLAQWIERLITSRGYVMTAEDEKSIWEALEEIADDPDISHRRLSSVYTQLPSHLKAQLDPWVGDKPLAQYFDNEEDSFSLGNFTCIEMGEVLRQPRIARAFIDYAFYRIRKMLEENRTKDTIVPTVIYLEECWFLLEDEQFAERVRDWLKTLAKLTAHVVMATQSLEDIVESKSTVFASIRDNMPTRIYLPNRSANTDSLSRLYRTQFELTDDQIDKIAKATPKQHYFIVKPGVARMVKCSFSPKQLAILRSDSKALSTFDRHQASGRENWVENYVAEINNGS